jgi:hypothetical protein
MRISKDDISTILEVHDNSDKYISTTVRSLRELGKGYSYYHVKKVLDANGREYKLKVHELPRKEVFNILRTHAKYDRFISTTRQMLKKQGKIYTRNTLISVLESNGVEYKQMPHGGMRWDVTLRLADDDAHRKRITQAMLDVYSDSGDNRHLAIRLLRKKHIKVSYRALENMWNNHNIPYKPGRRPILEAPIYIRRIHELHSSTKGDIDTIAAKLRGEGVTCSPESVSHILTKYPPEKHQ